MMWFLYVLYVFMLLFCCSDNTSSPSSSSSKDKCPTFCFCENTAVICGKDTYGLKKIPEIPRTTDHFTFINGNISTVNKTVLSPISKCPLLYLALLSDNITVLSQHTFEDFHQLETLDLSGNSIRVELLKNAFLSLTSKLKHFVLSNMNINDIPKDLFEAQKADILSLDLSSNKLTVFDNDSFLEAMPHLDRLDLSKNHMTFFSGSNAELTILNLNNNNLRNVPHFCLSNGNSRFHSLKMLTMVSNALQSLNTSSFSCLTKVQTLSLSRNNIIVLDNNTFSNLPSLKLLELNNLKNLKHIDELAFNSTSLLDLNLSEMSDLNNETFPRDFPFKWAPKLSTFDLSFTKLMLPPGSLKEMFSQLKSIESLNLQNTHLNTIPNNLCQLHKLKILNLGSNYLPSWDDDTFANMTHLTYISLDNNGIRLINETSFPVEMRTSIKKMSLGGNDFLCTCDLQWFRTWMDEVMKNKTVTFLKYPQNYFCSKPKHLRLDKFNPTYASCHRFIISGYIFVVMVVGCFVLLLTVMVTLIYRCRWKIRYYIYTRQHYQPLPGRDDRCIYDAFVIFSDDYSDWVFTELLNFLEHDKGLKLCISVRDFAPGKMIVDNIMESLCKSRKIILILSQNFVRSQWCQFETALTLRANKEVVIIHVEKVDKSLMFPDLLALNSNAVHITWKNDDEAKTNFRNCLASKMGSSTVH